MCLTKRESSAVLAGLRLLQAHLDNRLLIPNDGDVDRMRIDPGMIERMTSLEIDLLCESIDSEKSRSTQEPAVYRRDGRFNSDNQLFMQDWVLE